MWLNINIIGIIVDWHNKILKYITVFIIAALVINPEFAQIGLFIDAVGLDMLILLFGIQFLSLGTIAYDRLINPVRRFMPRFLRRTGTWRRLWFSGVSRLQVMTIPVEVILMYLLVGSMMTHVLHHVLAQSEMA